MNCSPKTKQKVQSCEKKTDVDNAMDPSALNHYQVDFYDPLN